MEPTQGDQQQFDQGQQAQSTDSGSTGGNVNPAWNEMLQGIPQEFHGKVIPHLQQWDNNYQQGIQKVHSQYEGYKPFVDGGVTPDEVDFALGLMNAVSTNPQEVLSALQSWIDEENGGQGLGDTQQQFDSGDENVDPRISQMEEAMQNMAQIMLSQREQEQQAQADQELQQELSSLQEKYKDRGQFDEDYVIGIALNTDGDLEKAVERYYQMQDQILSRRRSPGPPVLGPNGSSLNSPVDTRKMSSKDTRNYVASVLAQAAQNNQ